MFPGAPEPFLDLSTGINPHPYPLPQLSADRLTRLPATGRSRRAHATSRPTPMARRPRPMWWPVRARRSCLGADGIPVGARPRLDPGADLLRSTPARPSLPAITWSRSPRSASSPSARIAIVVNPNNPDGRIVAKDALLALADRLRRRGGLLLVDEAFMDVGPYGVSLADQVERGNIVVLRSFGKFYGLAGLAELRPPRRVASPRHSGLAGHRRGARHRRRGPCRSDWREKTRGARRGGAQARCAARQRGTGDRRRHIAVPPGADARTRRSCFSGWARPASWCGASPSIPRGCASGFPVAKPNGSGSAQRSHRAADGTATCGQCAQRRA